MGALNYSKNWALCVFIFHVGAITARRRTGSPVKTKRESLLLRLHHFVHRHVSFWGSNGPHRPTTFGNGPYTACVCLNMPSTLDEMLCQNMNFSQHEASNVFGPVSASEIAWPEHCNTCDSMCRGFAESLFKHIQVSSPQR